MTQWEYLRVVFSNGKSKMAMSCKNNCIPENFNTDTEMGIDDFLCCAGKEGWELVSVQDASEENTSMSDVIFNLDGLAFSQFNSDPSLKEPGTSIKEYLTHAGWAGYEVVQVIPGKPEAYLIRKSTRLPKTVEMILKRPVQS